uniref:Chemokine interleukin-8-like domain-containing protein n=1 Tax=Oryzias latipes TaxID=8090 RepID=A0A3P9M8H0_ORYLA
MSTSSTSLFLFHTTTAILAGPEKCCFAFRENPVPLKRVTRIIRTHPRCQQKAFM